MLEYGYLVLRLARIATSLVGRDSAQGERVANNLDNIAECSREIAGRLQNEPEPDIKELTGRLDFYTGLICRTLGEIVSKQDADSNQRPLVTEGDITSLAKRLADLANELKDIKATKKDRRHHKRLVDELQMVAGYLGAQAEEIRSTKGKSNKSWRNLRPAMMTVGTGLAASWAALEAASTVSFEHINENYGWLKAGWRRLTKQKDELPDEEVADASIPEDDVGDDSLT